MSEIISTVLLAIIAFGAILWFVVVMVKRGFHSNGK